MNPKDPLTRPEPGPIPNSYWLLADRLACGEYPGDMDESGEHRLTALLRAGITAFVDLTEEGELTGLGPLIPYRDTTQRLAGSRAAISWTRHPIVDRSIPTDNGEMTRILDTIDTALENGLGVYLHCWGGVGRTGTVAGCWLRRRGLTADEATARLAALWTGVEKSARRPRTPGEKTQLEFIANWAESPASSPASSPA